MSDVKIQVLQNGPLMIKGAIEILDSKGDILQTTAQAALCRCGQSSKKPFCDGTHRTAGFQHVCTRQTQG